MVLDNHVSRADWCCNETDGNGLWYNAEYPESKWLTDWQTIVRRYKSERWVVGADLLNELLTRRLGEERIPSLTGMPPRNAEATRCLRLTPCC